MSIQKVYTFICVWIYEGYAPVQHVLPSLSVRVTNGGTHFSSSSRVRAVQSKVSTEPNQEKGKFNNLLISKPLILLLKLNILYANYQIKR